MTPYGTCPVCKRTLYARVTCCQEAILEPLLDMIEALVNLWCGALKCKPEDGSLTKDATELVRRYRKESA